MFKRNFERRNGRETVVSIPLGMEAEVGACRSKGSTLTLHRPLSAFLTRKPSVEQCDLEWKKPQCRCSLLAACLNCPVIWLTTPFLLSHNTQ